MKLVTDNAFSKAWKKPCPTCNPDTVNSILWYNKQCHNCKKVYTEEDMADKKYTEEDMKKCWDACLDFNKPSGLDSGINYKDFINSLNKQD